MIEGKVFTGEGKASKFLSLEPYRKFIREKEGFKPYPGTLNLETDPGSAEEIKKKAEKHRMEPQNFEGDELGGLDLYRVRIEAENCCIVDPDLSRYGKDKIEIVAEAKLRDKLQLSDGDIIKVKPRS